MTRLHRSVYGSSPSEARKSSASRPREVGRQLATCTRAIAAASSSTAGLTTFVHNLSVSDDFDAPESLSPRARRAMPLIAGALAPIVVVGIVYLPPSSPTSHSVLRAAPSPTPPPLVSQQYQVAYDFLTSTAGWALVADQASAVPKFWV